MVVNGNPPSRDAPRLRYRAKPHCPIVIQHVTLVHNHPHIVRSFSWTRRELVFPRIDDKDALIDVVLTSFSPFGKSPRGHQGYFDQPRVRESLQSGRRQDQARLAVLARMPVAR